MRTLIFDCDGVLAETELYGHLPVFNVTFEEFDLGVGWSVEEYGHTVAIGEGKERLRLLLTQEFVAANGIPPDADELDAMVLAWHARKTEIFRSMVAQGLLPARPGIVRLAAGLGGDWRLAVASTST